LAQVQLFPVNPRLSLAEEKEVRKTTIKGSKMISDPSSKRKKLQKCLTLTFQIRCNNIVYDSIYDSKIIGFS
jgi:hypothetical protein